MEFEFDPEKTPLLADFVKKYQSYSFFSKYGMNIFNDLIRINNIEYRSMFYVYPEYDSDLLFAGNRKLKNKDDKGFDYQNIKPEVLSNIEEVLLIFGSKKKHGVMVFIVKYYENSNYWTIIDECCCALYDKDYLKKATKKYDQEEYAEYTMNMPLKFYGTFENIVMFQTYDTLKLN